MKLSSKFVVFSFVLAAAGCGTQSEVLEDQAVGRLELALTGTDGSGQQYRLRNATFDINGYPFVGDFAGFGSFGGSSGGSSPIAKTVSSETNPGDPLISVRLLPGNYTVALTGNAWYIEQLKAGTTTRVDKAVLVSERLQYVWVNEGGVSPVAFRFGVGSDLLIDFRHGDLQICAEFERPGDSDRGAAGGAAFAGSFVPAGTYGSGCNSAGSSVPSAGVGGGFAVAPPVQAGTGGAGQ